MVKDYLQQTGYLVGVIDGVDEIFENIEKASYKSDENLQLIKSILKKSPSK